MAARKKARESKKRLKKTDQSKSDTNHLRVMSAVNGSSSSSSSLQSNGVLPSDAKSSPRDKTVATKSADGKVEKDLLTVKSKEVGLC
jgi:hypothetical protein